MSNPFKISIWLVTIFLLLSSCKAKKSVDDNIKLKHKSSKELVELLTKSRLKGDWISTKGNVNLIMQGEDNSLRFNLRMRIDSATWVSMSKASVPVGTALISSDSVKFLNKLKKTYFLENFEVINTLLNTEVDYELLQDFFLGNPVAFDNEEDYNVKIEDNRYLISSEKSKKIEKLIRKGKIKDEPILYRCWIEPVHYKCEKVVINLLTQETTLEVQYADWEDIGGQMFPMTSSLLLTAPTDTISISMDYSRVELNEPNSMPFNIPNSYDAIELKNDEE